MNTTGSSNEDDRSGRYRVWIIRYTGWQPRDCHDIPPEAVALEPAEPGTFSAMEAERYVAAFNRTALAGGGRKIWAVALPVTSRYQGDAEPGQTLTAAARKKSPSCASQASTHNGLPPREYA